MMWKRLNFSNRTRETLADNPSPPPEDEFKRHPYEIPNLDFHSTPNPPFAKHEKTVSQVPTVAASSVYSQPARSPWLDDEHGISPPESPQLSAEHRDDGRVSPVEEHPDGSRRTTANSSTYQSYIPIPRKPTAALLERRSTVDMVLGTHSPSSTGQLTPGNPYYIPTGIENIPPESSVEASKRGVFADKASRLAGKLAKPREPWKGASGRTALVDPVKDTPQTSKIAIPPRYLDRPSPKNTPTQGETLHVSDSHVSVIMRPNREIGADTPTQAKSHYFTASTDNDTDFDHDFDFVTAGAPYHHDNSSAERQEHEDTLAALTARRRSDLDDRDNLNSRFSWSTHATGTTHRTTQSRDTMEPPSPPPPMPTTMPPIFRKSVAASHDSRSSQQAVPSAPSPIQEPSILDRKRPIPKDDLPTTPRLESSPGPKSQISTMRKPVGGASGLGISTNVADLTPVLTQSPSTTINNTSKDKDLPLAPGLLSSTKDAPVDHVELLRSQIDDLAHRRANIQRAIHNLTKAQSTNRNPMLTDWRTARDAEKRIQGLKDELADINREDHELGLKLHRAYKRREREGEMAGTSALWVRRVTG